MCKKSTAVGYCLCVEMDFYFFGKSWTFVTDRGEAPIGFFPAEWKNHKRFTNLETRLHNLKSGRIAHIVFIMMLKASALLSRSGIARVGGAGTLRSATTSRSMSTMMKGSSLGESIPEEWLGPDVETHGEWDLWFFFCVYCFNDVSPL